MKFEYVIKIKTTTENCLNISLILILYDLENSLLKIDLHDSELIIC